MIMALLLDLANTFGGFLLAIALLRLLPRVGDDLGRFAARVAPFGWLVGIVALVAAGFYLIVHLVSGPQVFHFEVVGLGVGIALLWDRLRGRTSPARAAVRDTTTRRDDLADTVVACDTATDRDTVTIRDTATDTATVRDTATGWALLLAIFGIIAIIVGIQGLFTPD